MTPSPSPRLVPLALPLLLLACGGGEPAGPPPGTTDAPTDAPTDGGDEAATPPATPTPERPPRREGPLPQVEDFAVELVGPPAFVPGHPQQLPDYGDDLRRLIDPENDDSPGERVAVRVEAAAKRLFEALHAGDRATAEALLAPDFAGLTGLLPELGPPLFDDGALRVRDEVRSDEVRRSLDQALEALAGSGWSGVEARGEVVEVEALGDGRWRCVLEQRRLGTLEGVRAQLDALLTLEVAADDRGRTAPLVLAASLSEQRLVERPAPVFEEVSGHVLGGLPHLERELLKGCSDYAVWVDRRHIPFRTGILGMALGDVNGDGLEDLYVSQIGGFPNRLLLHQPDGSVRDAGAEAGVDLLETTRGALLADLDGDAHLDLVVGRTGSMVVFWNDGEGRFPGAPTVLPGPDDEPVYSISAGDPDRDGDLDLFAARYATGGGDEGVPTPYHDAANGTPNLYFRNEGGRRFTDAAEESGLLARAPRYSFIGLWEDLTGDGLLDLYVVNDFGLNELFEGDGEGHFRERAGELGLQDMAAGMGVSVADADLDGDLDVYVTNMHSAHGLRATAEPSYRAGDPMGREMHRRMALGNTLLLRGPDGAYTPAGPEADVRPAGWAWGGLFHDWNLDGLPDLYAPNGFYSGASRVDLEGYFWRHVVRVTPPEPGTHDEYWRNWGALSFFNTYEGFSYNGHERSLASLNLGGGRFADVSAVSDADFEDDGRVAARVDWDGDGRLDLLLVNRTGPRVRLLRNVHPSPGHRVALELLGANGPAGAVGARVRVEREDGRVITRTVYAGEGLLGQSTTRLFFGLADSAAPVDAEVRWPDGEVERFEGLTVDRGWTLRRGGAREERPFTASPFEGRGAAPLERSRRPVDRTVLATKLPLRHLSFPAPGGRRVALGELERRARLLVFWDPESGAGADLLGLLAELRPEVDAAGAAVHPVAYRDGDGADPRLAALGLAEAALGTGEKERMLLELLLLEVLDAYDELPLPVSLLFDRGSNLCAVHFGAPRSEELLEDLAAAAAERPRNPYTLELSGGRWLGPPARAHRRIIRALMLMGERAMAEDLRDAQAE
jgi:hypothetical protein